MTLRGVKEIVQLPPARPKSVANRGACIGVAAAAAGGAVNHQIVARQRELDGYRDGIASVTMAMGEAQRHVATNDALAARGKVRCLFADQSMQWLGELEVA
jgi:hypothetical protein